MVTSTSRRAFGVEMPFEFFLYNDEEDFIDYLQWKAVRELKLDEFPPFTSIRYEGQYASYVVYKGDLDEWFTETDGYSTKGRYADGETGWTLYFNVYLEEREVIVEKLEE